ncbi:hypothetical protein AAC387_Pa10g1323 [Persea americana]
MNYSAMKEDWDNLIGKPLVKVALWLLVLCSGINAAFGSANKETKGVVLCYERERQALLKFKHALNASSDTLTSWVGDNCCRWEGVGCNSETGHVVKLNLRNTINMDSGIVVLDLSRNKLTGQVPSCFEDSHDLYILDLSYNNLDGMIPNIFTSPRLLWLQLSHNNLSGVLPSSIGVRSSLLALALSGNWLSGSIPRWLGENTSSLVILNLRSNMFHGNIPPQLSLLSSLQILDLANNRLSGKIPTSFGNFTSMAMTGKLIRSIFPLVIRRLGNEMEYVTVIIKGIEMKYTKTLSLVTTMDLSRNNLYGEIPQELTSLHGLQSLNLSGNHLEGKIPKTIGSLKQLESLDLSQNHLSGKIPSSISSLTFLSKLNLSNNNLSGTIPSGNQLQTLLDPSIYAGNYDLCGPPLPKLCSAEVVPQPPDTFHGEDEKDGTEHWLFYVVVALGFIAGFWLTCGILIFSKSGRIAYFRFFDRLNERLDGFYVKMVATVMKKIKG